MQANIGRTYVIVLEDLRHCFVYYISKVPTNQLQALLHHTTRKINSTYNALTVCFYNVAACIIYHFYCTHHITAVIDGRYNVYYILIIFLYLSAHATDIK